MEQVGPPVAGDELRQDDGDGEFRLHQAHAVQLMDDGLDNLAVGAAQRPEGDALTVAGPVGTELLQGCAVPPMLVGEVHGDGLDLAVLGDDLGVVQSLNHAGVDAGNEHHHTVPAGAHEVHAACGQDGLHPDVMPVDVEEGGHHDGHQQDDDPGPVGKACHGDDQHDNEGDDGAQAVDDGLHLPGLTPEPEPPDHHARLADGEAQEHTHRIKGQQVVFLGAEEQHQDARRDGQDENAIGEDQAVPLARELSGQEAVPGMEGGQAGEVRISRVRGQGQDGHGEARGDEVDQLGEAVLRSAKDEAGQLGEQGLGGIWVVGQVIVVRQVGDAQEHGA